MNSSTHIDFGIRADDLRLDHITERLGIKPTSGFNPNESYLGKEKVGYEIRTVERRRPSFGVWHFSTEGLVTSSELEDHADFLLAILEPSTEAIGELFRTGTYSVQLTFWHVGPSGFDLKSATMARLAIFCDRMSFTCFDVSEMAELGTEGKDVV